MKEAGRSGWPGGASGKSSTVRSWWRFARGTESALLSLPGWIMSAASVLGAIGVWWLVSTVVVNDPVLLPTPSSTIRDLITLATQGHGYTSLWSDVSISTGRALIGWSSAVVGGILVGSVMAAVKPVRQMLDPFVEFGRPLPPLAFAPLLVVWLGIGPVSKYTIVFIGSFPIMIIATVAAARGVDEQWRRTALSLGASPMYLFAHVTLPAMLPEILTAMRIASGLAWGALVAAEMIAAHSGLGYMIITASTYVDTATIFVGIVAIGTLAFSMDRILRLIERRVVPWRGLEHS